MKQRQTLLLLLCWLATVSLAQAQKVAVTIKGRVVHAETNAPVAKVNVFLSGTTIGTSTDASGNYTIQDSIPKGNYSLVFSHIEYDTDAQAVKVVKSQTFEFDMLMVPKKTTLNEVSVSAKKDRKWQKQLERFQREFIGTSSNAFNCKIVNPWILNFTEKGDTLLASSNGELEIENRTLGYKVYCLVENFKNLTYYTVYKGYYRFEALKAKNKRQEKKWQTKRTAAFNGSFRHFICALLYERVAKEGFEVYTTPQSPEVSRDIKLYNIDPKKLYKQDAKGNTIVVPEFLRVIYNLEREETGYLKWKSKHTRNNTSISVSGSNQKVRPQGSWLSIAGNRLKVSSLGLVMDDPTKVRSVGYWGWERVGDMLPSDFFPDKLMQAIKVSRTQSTKKLQLYTETHPQEKVYLHQDKGYYAVGDTLWLSGYVVNAWTHAPSNLSKILHVELIDERNQVKQALKLFNDKGKAVGEFVINSKHAPGMYRLRAYTTLMKDADPSFFFNRQFEIGRMTKKDISATLSYQSKADHTQETVSYDLKLDDNVKQRLLNQSLKLVVKGNEKTYGKQVVTIDESGKIKGQVKIPTTEKAPYVALEAKASVGNEKFSQRFHIPIHSYQKRLMFFPEGGEMVANIPNYIAFKAIDPQGKGSDVKGIIVDGDGKTVANFESTHLGMGKFKFVPQKDQIYTAQINLGNQTSQTFALPKVKEKGLIMHVADVSEDIISVTIRTSDKKIKGFRLIGHSRGNPVYTMAGKLKRYKPNTIKILKSSLPAGIMHFTLFNEQFVPHSERLVFVKKRDELHVEANFEKDSYATREKVTLKLETGSSKYKNSLAYLSVSVTDMDMVQKTPQQTHILSYLLLTSDLKGYIENPNFYFKDNQAPTRQAADLLMMTQGWRRFNWQQVFDNNQSAPEQIQKRGFSVSGTMTNSFDKPLADGTVTLIAKNFFKSVKTDKNGRFSFDNLMMIDGTKLMLKGTNKKGKSKVQLVLDKPKDEATVKVSPLKDYPRLLPAVASKAENYLKNQRKQADLLRTLGINTDEFIELKEVEVKARKIKGREYKKKKGQLYARPNFRLDVASSQADVSAATNFLSYIRGKIPGIQIGPNIQNGKVGIFYRGSNRSTMNGKKDIMYLLNGAPTTIEALMNLPIQQIDYIDMISSSRAVMYGAEAVNGVMAVYLKENVKSNNTRTNKKAPGVLNFTFAGGYHIARQFYVPPYDNEAFVKQDIPDLRSTIYWNPYIKTKNEEATISFYNADAASTYKVVIEGISTKGEIGRKVYYYTVKGKE